MTLQEEYENQQSWRTSSDKLTFIVCAPHDSSPIKPHTADTNDLMRGDINFFIYAYEAPDEDVQTASSQGWLTGEIDVMIASPSHRKRGLGRASVNALLGYLRRHIVEVLGEYAGDEPAVMKGLMVKIKENNVGSRRLFEKLGFAKQGEVNYFGEVVMALGWEDVKEDGEYEEVEYERGL